MMTKGLSVIVPLYNGKKYIIDTITMILNSEYKNLEVIVVNDGSNDGSDNLVSSIAENDDRVSLYTKQNEGVVSARNYGVGKAKGEYLCFVDQDDFVKPFMYKKIISKIEKDGSDFGMCSSGRNIDGFESVFDQLDDGTYEGNEVREKLLYPILFNGFKVPIAHSEGKHYPHIWTCVFKRSFWKEMNLKFRAYVNFEDDLLVKVEALSKANKVSTVSDVGYLWRVNLKSETYAHHYVNNIGIKQDMEYQDMINSLEIINPSIEFLQHFKRVKYCKQYLDAVHYLSSPEVKKSIKSIRQYYNENIYNRDFKDAIKGCTYIRKGRIKPRIILPLLKKHMTISSYIAEILLDQLLLISLHSKTLTKLERKIKGGN